MRLIPSYILMLLAIPAMALCACGGTKEKTGASGQVIEITDGMIRHGGADTIRFGHLNEGEIALRSITLANKTAKPTVIVSHERSCGCVNVEYERRPIMPEGEAKVDFTFDSRGEYGWQMKIITLRLGAAGVPLKIYVEAEVEW